MSLYRTLLFPTDLSACASTARSCAHACAAHSHGAHLLYVGTFFDTSEHLDTVRRSLEAQAAEFPCAAHVSVLYDPVPALAILRQAVDHDVDLIVMGTHGRRGFSRLLLGSTAREVVQLAPCPVLTVRCAHDESAPPPLEGGALLVAIDFSDASRAALRHAARLARAFNARLDLVHVNEDLFRPVGEGYVLRATRDLDPGLDERLLDTLRAWGDEHARDGVRLGSMVVAHGLAVKSIVDEAQRRESALVVLGTRGMRGIDHLVMGSVAEAVVRMAPCPVLTVKTDEALALARVALVEDIEDATGDLRIRTRPLPVF